MAKRKTAPTTPKASPSPPARKSTRAHQRSEMAYELLANQPVSLAELSPESRGEVVISAVLDNEGNTVVLSRVKDLVWELWPFAGTPNTRASMKRLNWSGISAPYREACQNVLYAWWKLGRGGRQPPGVSRLRSTLSDFRIFCCYITALGISSFADLQALHIANFVYDQKARGLAQNSLANRLLSLELLYLFRDEHDGTLPFHPWPESSAATMAGQNGQRYTNTHKACKTPLIPIDVAQTLFRHAEIILNCADDLLNDRDLGNRSLFRDPEIKGIRSACFYLIGVLTGMRSSEISSIELGAGRTEIQNGITFDWLESIEHKTKKGAVEYLMPAMGHRILSIMERWSRPYRELLATQIAEMEQRPGKPEAKELQWLSTALGNLNRLFLGKGKTGISLLSDHSAGVILKQFAQDAGTNWSLAPHQMRRLYAYTFVRHRLGDLLFLKEQFKHARLDTSQLYCSNPRQDSALYDDILTELLQYKASVVAQWLEKDEPLAGGAGHKIMKLRAHDFDNRKELITETSKRVNIRSTGHSWCLAQDEGCGGSGIYAKGSCAGCHNGLIDRRFVPIWQEAYRHHKELLLDAEALGPGAVRRVKEDLRRAGKILFELGIYPEQQADRGEQSDAR